MPSLTLLGGKGAGNRSGSLKKDYMESKHVAKVISELVLIIKKKKIICKSKIKLLVRYMLLFTRKIKYLSKNTKYILCLVNFF